ncbi:MAG: FHA domain-containing protein [Pyrinomonadaceae bacterium]
MLEVILTYPTPDGSKEIPLNGGSISLGRGSDADLRFDDDGLSRLHAAVYREGDRVWVLDEGSTNGTSVNGNPVPPSGTPLHNGDAIKIGHYTNIRVFISARQEKSAPVLRTQSANPVSVSSAATNNFHLLPIALTLGALLIIGVSAIIIGVKVLGNNQPEIVRNSDDDAAKNLDDDEAQTPTLKKTEKPVKTDLSPTPEAGNSSNKLPDAAGTSDSAAAAPQLPAGKKYQQMSNEEKNDYIRVKSEKIARIIGNQNGEPIPPEAVAKIRGFLEGYASRINRSPVDNCTGSGWLKSDMTSVLKRASKNAPAIIPAFNEQGMDPQIGLYLAMIESEHCSCLQSGTGPLGIFQFTFATAKTFFPNDGSGVVRGASPSNPDIRCQLDPAANGSARYMKFLTGWFGTGPLSIPLAIGSYNSGEGGGATNLRKAMAAGSGQERTFWTLIANSDKLAKQFQVENFKYVPKFFAAAIIGENPQDFGVNLLPLSTYTK